MPRVRTLLALAVVGLGVFWLAAAPGTAAPATTPSLPGSLTTTTALALGEQAQTEVDGLTAQVQAVQAQIGALDAQLGQKVGEYFAGKSELEAANARLAQLRREVADAEAKKTAAQKALEKRIRSVYMSGGRDQLLQLLLLADSLQDLYNRVRLVSTLADQDKRIVSDLEDSSDRLDLLVKAVDTQRREGLALRSKLTHEAKDIQATLDQKRQVLAALDTDVKAVIEQERQRQLAEQARLEQERQAQLLAAQQAAQNHLHPRGADVLDPYQIAVAARQAGFTGQDLIIAVAVALAESGGNAHAIGDVTIGGSFGLWQIFCMAHPDLIPPSDPDSVAWHDPYQNARFAYEVSGGHNWRPWSTYKHGTYLAHMYEAQEAVIRLVTADDEGGDEEQPKDETTGGDSSGSPNASTTSTTISPDAPRP